MWNTLKQQGYITIPIFNDKQRSNSLKELQAIVQKFQEFKTMEKDGLVMGGFGAFGNPSSFHNPFVRKIRKLVHPMVLNTVFQTPLENDPSMLFEQDIDRLMIRTPYQKVGKESWHRDESKHAKEGDTIFGGWVNFDDFSHYLSACPGTHLEEEARLKNKGFAKIKDKEKYESLKQSIEVPPGHLLIFYERMVHEVRPTKRQTIHRLFMGWRLTKSEQPLYKDIVKSLKTMSVVPIKSGQIPQMYSASHWNFHRQKIEDWSNRISDKCKEIRQVSSGKESGKRYRVVHQRMKSMKEYGFDMYEPYSTGEIEILIPHRPNKKQKTN